MSLRRSAADDESATAASRAALAARFRAYAAKYSAYDDIAVLSPQGQVLARLDRGVAEARCSDPLITVALRPGVPFVEHGGVSDVLGGQRDQHAGRGLGRAVPVVPAGRRDAQRVPPAAARR